MTVNFGKVSHDYAKYRDHLPAVLFDHLRDKGIDFDKLNVVELGSGSGIFSRQLANQGAYVVGIEPSNELIDKAVLFDKAAGINSIQYIQAKAEDFNVRGILPIIMAVRSWHWFDRIKVIQNIKNHLMQSGLLIVINSIFLPNSVVAQTTFRVLIDNKIELKPAGSNAEVKERRNGFPINWFDEWEANSFHAIEEWQHEYNLEFTHEEWCGKIRSVSWLTNENERIRRKVTNDLLKALENHEGILNIPHRYSIVVLRQS